jgi:hypothetical protein
MSDTATSLTSGRSFGFMTTLLGFPLICCTCLRAINALVFLATSLGPSAPTTFYGRIFSTRVNNFLSLATHIVDAELVCIGILAPAIPVLGIVTLVRGRGADQQ